MKDNRKSKILKAASLYVVLVGLIITAFFANYDVKFNHYKTLGSSVVQAENYFGQFFENGWLVVGIGGLFAFVWAGSLHNQLDHTKLFKYGIIITSILTFLWSLFSVEWSRIDCGSSCGWPLLPQNTAYLMGIVSTLFWFTASMLFYKFMLRNSSSD